MLVCFEAILKDPENFAWLWAFFQNEEAQQRYEWAAKTSYSYQGKTFQFKYPVFASARKEKNKEREDVFEELSPRPALGKGCFGEVKAIGYTFSKNIHGDLQVKNNKRVVKYFNHAFYATKEFQAGRNLSHLHMKPPNNRQMVMKEKKGIHLLKPGNKKINPWLVQSDLEKLALSRAILLAVKTQIHDNNLVHNDLNVGNILIDKQPLANPASRFKVSIIDVGLAKTVESDSWLKNRDYYFLSGILACIWAKGPVPLHISKAIALLASRQMTSIEDCLKCLDRVILFPVADSQNRMDILVSQLETIEAGNPVLAAELMEILKTGTNESSSVDLKPVQSTVLICKNRLKENGFFDTAFSETIFHSQPEKQSSINAQFIAIHALKAKAKALKTMNLLQESEELLQLTRFLQKELIKVSENPQFENSSNWIKCKNRCEIALDKNQNLLKIRRNHNYIFAEIAVILASLVVLYPIMLGLNYLVTQNWGFFTQTETSKSAEIIKDNFFKLATN